MSIANLPWPAIPVRSIGLSHGYVGLLRPVTSLRIIGVYSVVVVLLWLMLFLCEGYGFGRWGHEVAKKFPVGIPFVSY